MIEAICLEIIMEHTKNILVTIVYRPPSAPVIWYDAFEALVSKFYDEQKIHIVVGDFNVNLNEVNKNRSLCEIMKCGDFIQVIKEPTRITTLTATLIDHIYVLNTYSSMVQEAVVSDLALSDHQPVGITLARSSNGTHKVITYRDMASIIFFYFNNDLERM